MRRISLWVSGLKFSELAASKCRQTGLFFSGCPVTAPVTQGGEQEDSNHKALEL
jgi:hypothetical protein